MCLYLGMPLLSNGAEVRQRRELRGMTLAEFARASGFSVNHVSQVELGKSNAGPGFLKKAAEILGCQIADITSGSFTRRRAAKKKNGPRG